MQATRLNLENIKLCEISQVQKGKCFMIPPLGSEYNGQIVLDNT